MTEETDERELTDEQFPTASETLGRVDETLRSRHGGAGE